MTVACRSLILACALQGCLGYSLQHASPPRHVRSPRTAVALIAEDVKVTIKPRSASAAVQEAAQESKVTVRVRPNSERVSTEPDTQLPEVTTSIKVNKPVPKPAAPTPVAPARPVEEEMLLNATQAANCTLILEALQAGANPNVRDPKGRTPLHFMAGVGLAPACVLLIHFGAQLNARDADGLTPAHMAAGYANARTLRVLVAAGADIELSSDAQGKPLEVVKQLGEYQYGQVYGDKKKKKELFKKKKDEKLEKLKNCLDVLLEPEKTKADNPWDELLEETLRVIAI